MTRLWLAVLALVAVAAYAKGQVDAEREALDR